MAVVVPRCSVEPTSTLNTAKTDPMPESLQAVAARQGGLFRRAQAITAGFEPREFDRLVASRCTPFTRVRYGVYTSTPKWELLDERARELLVDRAALLMCDGGTVLCHISAARVHGLALVDAPTGLTHVTRLRTRGARLYAVKGSVKHHSGLLLPDETVQVDGVPVTSIPRTVIDLARDYGHRCGVVAADAAMALAVDPEGLYEQLERRVHDSQRATLLRVVADARPGAASPLETLGRLVLTDLGYDDLVLQYPIELRPGWIVRADLYSPAHRHVFECDGRVKYRAATTIADDPEEALWREKRREDLIRGLGFGMTRLTWADLDPSRRDGLARRIEREIRSQHPSIGA